MPPIFVSVSSNACNSSEITVRPVSGSQTMNHCCRLSALPSIAADMLPIVTDMFIQCRNVRSFAAHTTSQVKGGSADLKLHKRRSKA